MVSKQVLFFIVAALTVTAASNIQPTDLIDEVKEQVQQLKAIVQGKITSAHNYINNVVFAFALHSVNAANGGSVSLRQANATIFSQLDSIKNLAHLAGKDVSGCTNENEEILRSLPQEYMQHLSICLEDLKDQAKNLGESSKYIVDVSFNTVNHLEFQVKQCREDLSCILPILTEIEKDKIRLPQNIMIEVQTCENNILSTLKLSLSTCVNSSVAQYSTQAYLILGDIEICVGNEIIS